VPVIDRPGNQGNLLVADGVLVALVTTLALGTLIYRVLEGPEDAAGGFGLNPTNVVAVTLVLAALSSLIWHRPAAMPVLLVGTIFFLGSELLGTATPFLAFVPLMALYAVAASSRPTISGSAAGVMAIGAVAMMLANPGPLDDDVLDYLLSVGTAWLLGYGIRLNRVRTSLLAEQAKQFAREQAARTKSAIDQEQTRIARELHDIVAHDVVVIVAQAGASKRMFDAEPEQARQALTSIETLGREALVEMRRLLAVLWTHENGSKDPQPGLAQLPALVAQVERAGLPIRLCINGEPKALPAGVELNAYRIVAEALTNALKHAGPTRAEVELAYHPEFLELRVRDDGRGSSCDELRPGHGVVGMRQRALVLGGDVTVGPRKDRGFEVTARLPVDGERR
jgi:signal transduction histidine kinase